MKKLTKAGYEVTPVEGPDGILQVVGHGVDTTIYPHDEDTIQNLLDNVKMDGTHPQFVDVYVPPETDGE